MARSKKIHCAAQDDDIMTETKEVYTVSPDVREPFKRLPALVRLTCIA
jgi:hypothetical protein